MCGIVGYIGDKQAKDILLDGLTKLEYRGYDSAGITVIENGELDTIKCKGRLKNLVDKVAADGAPGHIGIGHTRWATHGEPSDLNSHPHTDEGGQISVVHNGIIENYAQLREWLKERGVKFFTQTDTEVVPNLIAYYYNGDLFAAVRQAVARLDGSFALGIVSTYEPDKIIATRKDSPLIVGSDDTGSYIASDVPAILAHTRTVYYLNDKEYVVLARETISFYDEDGLPIEKDSTTIKWDAASAEKGGYEFFMIKEINEQPKSVRDTMVGRIMKDKPVQAEGISFTKEQLTKLQRIYIVACGTAYHAGLVGKNLIEKLVRIPVDADLASEFRYRDPMIDENTLMIVLSQSGETADTLAAVRMAKQKGAHVIAICNTMGSSIARESSQVMYTQAGPEIAVASTKAYTTQLVSMVILTLMMADTMGTLDAAQIESIKNEMLLLPEKIQQILDNQTLLQRFSAEKFHHRDMFYLGRGLDYYVCMEGALKLKEISYIHTEAYAGGELKHGTIALIEEGTVVVALVSQHDIADKMNSNIEEVVTRGADVLAILPEDLELHGFCGAIERIPSTLDMLSPILAVIPMQLIAYYIAVQRGLDVDKPRNLAKSVTVE
ncbi:glutamine--fructose-6-phosphate transaminase (isomerizing) [Eubacteriales bacterium OttesenSCG-928-N14]|nr:glutamine--fructose-6-phosphate transaminase (isomerizing) [Eubacteriales bacterium OttesenSCG-928-N14]